MITLLESYVKIRMDLRELNVLRKVLGACSPAQLHEAGLTLGEIETHGRIYQAIKDYQWGIEQKSETEDIS